MWESWWSLGIDNFCPVSSLRLRLFQSRSRSRHWDSDFSVSVSSLRLGHFSLGLVIETQTFSVSVLVSMIQNWSCWSLSWLYSIYVLAIPCLVYVKCMSWLCHVYVPYMFWLCHSYDLAPASSGCTHWVSLKPLQVCTVTRPALHNTVTRPAPVTPEQRDQPG